MTQDKKVKYEALAGLNFEVDGQDRRIEPGEVVDDLPAESVKWLLRGGYIKVARPKKKAGGEG